MDRVGWEPDHNNCERWSSLDPDLLVIVAKNSDATSVCRLSQACKAGRRDQLNVQLTQAQD